MIDHEDTPERGAPQLPYHTIVIDCGPVVFVDSMGASILEQVLTVACSIYRLNGSLYIRTGIDCGPVVFVDSMGASILEQVLTVAL